MRAKEFIIEARRNPELNPKVQGSSAVYDILSKIPKDQLRQYGVSFNNILKLGVNPDPSYDTTPLGVYFYPADYYLGLLEFNSDVPYRYEANYIHIIHLTTNRIVDFSDAPAEIIQKIHQICKKYQDSDIGQEYEDIINPGIKAYSLLYNVAILSGSYSDSGIVSKFNSLLRTVGVDVVVDHGEGYIHESEPYQGVVLNPRAFRTIKTINNDLVAPEDQTRNRRYRYLFLWKSLSNDKSQNLDFINKFLEVYYSDDRPNDADPNPEDGYKIARRVIAYIIKDPSIANVEGLLTEDIISWLIGYGKLGDNIEGFLWGLYNKKQGYDSSDYKFPLQSRSQNKKEKQQQAARDNISLQQQQNRAINKKSPVLNLPDQEVK